MSQCAGGNAGPSGVMVSYITQLFDDRADTRSEGGRPASGGPMAEVFEQWRDRDWTLGEQPTLIDVRDSLVDCFAATHGPRFGETRAVLGLDATRQAVRASVEGMVRLAFQLAGGSYDRPTAGSLARVVTILAERSLEWGIPADVVFEHHCSMTRAVGLSLLAQRHLPEMPAQ